MTEEWSRPIKKIVSDRVPSQSLVRLDGGGLPSETLKGGSLERRESAGDAEGTVVRVSVP